MNVWHVVWKTCLALLLVSPWLGLLSVWRARRWGTAAAERAALANAGVTAILATAFAIGSMLPALNRGAGPGAAQAAAVGWEVSWVRWPLVSREAGPRPQAAEIVLSVGADPWNRQALAAIPWLTLAALLLPRRSGSASDDRTADLGIGGLLALEGVLLLVFAAQDAITFCVANEVSLLVMWWAAGRSGGLDRRSAAGAWLAKQYAGQLLWLMGLVGVALAVVWIQLESRSGPPVVRFGWPFLAELLPTAISRSTFGWHYWDAASLVLLGALVAGCVIRSGFWPFHRSWVELIQETSGRPGVLLLGVFGIVGSYGFVRFVAPLTSQNANLAGWLSWIASLMTLGAGLLALAQNDPRRVVAFGWLCWTGWCWVGLATGHPWGVANGWSALQSSAYLAVGWMMALELLAARRSAQELAHGGRLSRRAPRLAMVLCLLTLLSIGVPSPGRGTADVAIGLLALPLSVWTLAGAVAGCLLTSWALFWLTQRQVFGVDAQFGDAGETLPRGDVVLPDLSLRELAALMIPLLLLPAGWWLTLGTAWLAGGTRP